MWRFLRPTCCSFRNAARSQYQQWDLGAPRREHGSAAVLYARDVIPCLSSSFPACPASQSAQAGDKKCACPIMSRQQNATLALSLCDVALNDTGVRAGGGAGAEYSLGCSGSRWIGNGSAASVAGPQGRAAAGPHPSARGAGARHPGE